MAPETTYHYAVAALSPNGAGVQSTTISATTPAAPKSKDPPPQDAGARQAPPVTILVSNLTDGTDSDNNFGSADHAQAFTTGATSSTVASVTIISLDAEADDISLKVCGVDTNTHPTSTCTALTSPLSFTAGEMTFTVPTGTPLTLDANTTYSVVFNSPGDDTVRVEATWGDGEDSESLAGWSIRNRSQVQNTDNSWRDRGEDKAIRMAVSGTADATTTNPPTVENEIPDRSATVGTAFSHTFATDTFADADGDTLTYTATKADDTTLPTWLTFTANTRTFSGTPTAAETVSVKVTASDGNGGSVSDTFDIAVSTAPTDMVAPTILVSNMGQGADSNNDFTVLDVAQAFTTGSTTSTVKSVTIRSEDPQGDDFALKICEVDRNTHPTSTCTALTSPGSFPAGNLTFAVPTGTTLTLDANTTYSVVFNSPDGDEVRVDATAADHEDGSSLPGWSIRDESQLKRATGWEGRGLNISMRIAVRGTTPDVAATGIPTISGTAQVGQTLTASTSGIADPNGRPSQFAYQWKRYSADGATYEANIGSNSYRYRLTSSEFGKKVKVQVTFNDRQGYSEGPLVSAAYPSSGTVSARPGNPTAEDGTVTQREDWEYRFRTADFNYSRGTGGGGFTSLKITALDGVGRLLLDGVPITSGQLPKTINATYNRLSRLSYDPPNDAYGSPIATFKFKVNDGTQDSPDEYTMRINITSVNDPAYGRPHITGNAQVGYPLNTIVAIGDRDGVPRNSLNYQWQRYAANGTTFEANIGTNSSTYMLTPSEAGKRIRLKVSYTDDSGYTEMVQSDAYPSLPNQTVGEVTFQSIMGAAGDSFYGFTAEHGQVFTTGTHPNGYTLSRVVLKSEDPQGDDLAVKICGVNSSGNPTTSCTDLTVPRSFAKGLLSFTAPPGTTLAGGRTNYMVVISSPGEDSVRIDATRSDGFDSSAVESGWSIATRTRIKDTNGWRNVNGNRIRIAILGTIKP